ncbi:NAD(P)/FAD-dependent oxidoreductase [Streptomyces sp. SL13]|jgi:phytoene dehydrogenase-like protein|uniref:Pyridine nucleotide-disulfide oxidoreductase domain-containing protein 2 n=1 Tax=Streptantibioticus silvisoli TaxID=2705255 RepID=A0AA90H3M9_9ACTN|nr:NAD(P)/FAD-dependent oxidoreductase [Streptantibioticus silvisoli]MDI5961629.1 NAD(P)/FAD-dependent oxidoreductase [Streptantibioticus silvisoli]MDI5968210.1 NAD(P)/FAD-dependent oxidoreductase [Streptantibioticus silvisoli]
MPERTSYDAVIVGGGHNGLVAAAYLARAGRSTLVLERLAGTGGAAVSTRAFRGVDARLSRYSYLVSLLPRKIVDDLGLSFAVRRRRISSYTPTPDGGGLLVDVEDAARTRDSFRRLTGSDHDFDAWQRFYAMTGRVAARVFPTMTEPLPSRAELERLVDEPAAWQALFERPIGESVEAAFDDDVVRGVVLTDALIGTFSHAHDPSLRQNRCFLYHVIGGGTGDWDVPIGGMGAFTDALAGAARSAGAEIVTGAEVTAVRTDGTRAEVSWAGGTVDARHVLVNASPRALAALLDEPEPERPEGAQLKVNMVLSRLPRLRDRGVDPREAFAGTFHVAESYDQLATAYRQAAAGEVPAAPPSEIYCHSLTDPSILSAELVASGAQTLTLFGLHAPARLFDADPDGTREALLRATVAQLDGVLDEPLEDCLLRDADGRPCVEAKSPLDLEREVGLPGGHIFHRDLSWPYAEDGTGRWGVETAHGNVLLCGAGAVRGGGVSGVPGHNAAMAVLESD